MRWTVHTPTFGKTKGVRPRPLFCRVQKNKKLFGRSTTRNSSLHRRVHWARSQWALTADDGCHESIQLTLLAVHSGDCRSFSGRVTQHTANGQRQNDAQPHLRTRAPVLRPTRPRTSSTGPTTSACQRRPTAPGASLLVWLPGVWARQRQVATRGTRQNIRWSIDDRQILPCGQLHE